MKGVRVAAKVSRHLLSLPGLIAGRDDFILLFIRLDVLTGLAVHSRDGSSAGLCSGFCRFDINDGYLYFIAEERRKRGHDVAADRL